MKISVGVVNYFLMVVASQWDDANDHNNDDYLTRYRHEMLENILSYLSWKIFTSTHKMFDVNKKIENRLKFHLIKKRTYWNYITLILGVFTINPNIHSFN